DPSLLGAGQGGTFDDADQLASLLEYQLNNNSSLIDQGLDLAAFYGIDMGGHDFYNLGRYGQYDLGAAESPTGVPALPEPAGLGLLGVAGVAALRRRRRRA